jgi:hypothetical protein
MLKLNFYVPETHVEEVKSALFEAGAGTFDKYEQACWQTMGQGQFKPIEGSDPHIGQQDQLERVDEYRVEIICSEECIEQVIKALKVNHPYEEPAYEVLHMLDF